MSTRVLCEDCTVAFDAPNKNTRYCHVHRLARDLLRFGSASVRCNVPLCNTRFVPVVAKDFACWKHSGQDRIRGRSRYHITAKCVSCGNEGLVYAKDVKVCVACFKNPKTRKDVMGRVVRLADRLTADRTGK